MEFVDKSTVKSRESNDIVLWYVTHRIFGVFKLRGSRPPTFQVLLYDRLKYRPFPVKDQGSVTEW